jgi:Transposase domain (DUF772)
LRATDGASGFLGDDCSPGADGRQRHRANGGEVGEEASASEALRIYRGVTVMQFAEGLSDRQAIEAVRARIDWKYALGFEPTDLKASTYPCFTMDLKAVTTMRLLGNTSDYTFAKVPNPMAQAAREVQR